MPTVLNGWHISEVGQRCYPCPNIVCLAVWQERFKRQQNWYAVDSCRQNSKNILCINLGCISITSLPPWKVVYSSPAIRSWMLLAFCVDVVETMKTILTAKLCIENSGKGLKGGSFSQRKNILRFHTWNHHNDEEKLLFLLIAFTYSKWAWLHNHFIYIFWPLRCVFFANLSILLPISYIPLEVAFHPLRPRSCSYIFSSFAWYTDLWRKRVQGDWKIIPHFCKAVPCSLAA